MEVEANTKDDFLQNEYLAEIASLLGLECVSSCSIPLRCPRREETSRAIGEISKVHSKFTQQVNLNPDIIMSCSKQGSIQRSFSSRLPYISLNNIFNKMQFNYSTNKCLIWPKGINS